MVSVTLLGWKQLELVLSDAQGQGWDGKDPRPQGESKFKPGLLDQGQECLPSAPGREYISAPGHSHSCVHDTEKGSPSRGPAMPQPRSSQYPDEPVSRGRKRSKMLLFPVGSCQAMERQQDLLPQLRERTLGASGACPHGVGVGAWGPQENST